VDAYANNTGGYDTSEYDKFDLIGKVTNTVASLFFFLLCVILFVLLVLYILYSIGPIRIIVLALSKTISCGKKKKVAPAEVTEQDYHNPPMEEVCGIRTDWDTFPEDPEGRTGPADEFQYPMQVAVHNGIRKLQGSNRYVTIDDVIQNEGFCASTFRCCAKLAPMDILFRIFCLAPTSKKVSRDAWEKAEPQEVRIVGPGKEDYNIETNPFYSDAFLTKEKIQQQGQKTGQRTAKTPKSADSEPPPPSGGDTSTQVMKLE